MKKSNCKGLLKNIIKFLLFLFLSGCALHKEYNDVVYCRHEAVLCCMVMHEQGLKCRIVVGKWKGMKNAYHAQAQALIDGKWQYLHAIGGYILVVPQDDFIPTSYYNPFDFVRMYNLLDTGLGYGR